jgi:hypothetical protein
MEIAMSLRFRKSLKIIPGVRINLSKTGASLSLGRPGATVNIGSKGSKVTMGLPGTGLSYTTKLSAKSPHKPTYKQKPNILDISDRDLFVIMLSQMTASQVREHVKKFNSVIDAIRASTPAEIDEAEISEVLSLCETALVNKERIEADSKLKQKSKALFVVVAFVLIIIICNNF